MAKASDTGLPEAWARMETCWASGFHKPWDEDSTSSRLVNFLGYFYVKENTNMVRSRMTNVYEFLK